MDLDALRVRIGRVGNAFVMQVIGEVDISTRPLLTSALLDACGLVVPSRSLVLDLSGVTHFGAAGIDAVELAERWCRAERITLNVVVTPRIGFVLGLTDVGRRLRLVDSLVDAFHGNGEATG
ncbi:anti-anti-sigma regulatory factor [Lentzea atacamensis]|uniref:Anti-anti-sigma regulatory factor n=2 Tax=Lentzea atacamensis TaxID=531938 RepID=A0ABX9EDF8_9PSEU|nr:anti-anti-sigma regulatory factor [Lentzea atacamensis]